MHSVLAFADAVEFSLGQKPAVAVSRRFVIVQHVGEEAALGRRHEFEAHEGLHDLLQLEGLHFDAATNSVSEAFMVDEIQSVAGLSVLGFQLEPVILFVDLFRLFSQETGRQLEPTRHPHNQSCPRLFFAFAQVKAEFFQQLVLVG